MPETWVRSLGQEDTLEKEMATHSSILAWKIPRTEEPGGLQQKGTQRLGYNWATSLSNHKIVFHMKQELLKKVIKSWKICIFYRRQTLEEKRICFWDVILAFEIKLEVDFYF